jgi:general L-amino acid transport system permease protein
MTVRRIETDTVFVRKDFLPPEPPPPALGGLPGWVRTHLFSSPLNAAVTVAMLALIVTFLPSLVQWAFIDAVWTGDNREVCLSKPDHVVGACWAFINAKFGQFMLGSYPMQLRWRPELVLAVFFCGLAAIAYEHTPYRRNILLFMLTAFPVLAFWLLYGGLGLEVVETANWGGLLVTLVVAVTGIVASLPLGILLALGRRSKLPFIKIVSVVFIEFWRGVPLITVLFMASVMLPLFLPSGVNFDKLLRALIGVALFTGAYMAETVRGGLQAIPKGQFEGAASLGLGYWQSMRLIILPQALRIVIPGIVNSFISLFKDTSLVMIIGLFDLLGSIQRNFSDVNWSSPPIAPSGLLFAAAVFWVFCFSMSRYSMYMERKLNKGVRR